MKTLHPSHTTLILIVDDDAAGRETLAALLHAEQYQLAFADSGMAAIEAAATLRPDLILLDVMMPGMDGFEVCRRLRADPQLAEVPIMLVTALDDRESRLAGIEAGADDCVSKPYDRAELRARIRTIARLNRYRRLVTERTKFERVIELSPNGILIVHADGALHLANPALCRKLGVRDPEAMVGAQLQPYIAPELREQFMAELRHVITDPSYVARFESEMVRASAERLPVEVDAGYIEWDGMPMAQVIVRNISERKRAEAQITRHIERQAALRTIDNAITSSLDLQVIMNIVLDQVIDHLHVEAAAVLLRRPHSHVFEYKIMRGFVRSSLRHAMVRIGEGYAGQVILERRMLGLRELVDQPGTLSLLTEPCATYYGVPLIAKGQVEGVLEVFHRAPLAVDEEWLTFLEMLGGQAAIAIDHAVLFESMQRANSELLLAYTSTLEGWARALELRDKETEGHAQRVTDMTLALAQSMGVGQADLVHVQRGALLHDIGKMGIPDSILLKPGPLTDEEWEIVRMHPVYAYDMLAPIAYLRPALDIPYCHHERWDGTGYPRRLKGEEIPLAARIFAVVDVWDALLFDRPYRKGWPEEKVRAYIQEQSGTHFDPRVVEAFLRLHPGTPDDERLGVLLVDDEVQITQMLRRHLEDSFVVFTATNSNQALDILSREKIAVMLTDQRMPVISGLQLLERARYISPATLGILCSGYFDYDVLGQALNIGNVRGYIQKPWNVDELRRRIHEVAQQYRAAAQLSKASAPRS
jgi:PAS domain S-box-containing protein